MSQKPTGDYFENAEYIANNTRELRVIRLFRDADLRCMHLGLSLWAKKYGKIDCQNLKPGEFVVFTNVKENKLKIFGPGNVIAYVKSYDHRRIDLDVIRLIPKFFNGSEFDIKNAMKEVILRKAEGNR